MFGDILFAVMSVILGSGGIAMAYFLYSELSRPFSGANAPLMALIGIMIGLCLGLIIDGIREARRSYVRRKENEMED